LIISSLRWWIVCSLKAYSQKESIKLTTTTTTICLKTKNVSVQ